MSCHPGAENSDMKEMKRNITDIFNFFPEQVQAFIPLPMTLSSVIYYTGEDPLTDEKYTVIRDVDQRRKQHRIII
jgi:hypothetical protein